jgi:hypothetical protein
MKTRIEKIIDEEEKKEELEEKRILERHDKMAKEGKGFFEVYNPDTGNKCLHKHKYREEAEECREKILRAVKKRYGENAYTHHVVVFRQMDE